jgi:hypothetical protein
MRAFPLLLIPAIIYALFAIPAGAAGMHAGLAEQAFAIAMPSGTEWIVTRGHLITILATVCLFFEVLKSTRPSTQAIIENSASVGVFVVCLIAFLLAPGFGSTEFFLIVLMCVLDFLAGFVVMISTARRTVDYVN